MKHIVLILLLLLMSAVAPVASAETVVDISLGKVKMRSTTQLDSKSRRDVASIAAKIKKMRKSGVIKVRGDFPGAGSAAEFLEQSVFMAREVESYLNTLLSANYQVFVIVSAYSGAKRPGDNNVEILLYPQQMLLEELESLRFISTRIGTRPVAPAPQVPVDTASPGEPSGESGLLSAPRDEVDFSDTASKRERDKRSAEDAALANELVIKAKARAAERAKRRAAED